MSFGSKKFRVMELEGITVRSLIRSLCHFLNIYYIYLKMATMHASINRVLLIVALFLEPSFYFSNSSSILVFANCNCKYFKFLNAALGIEVVDIVCFPSDKYFNR